MPGELFRDVAAFESSMLLRANFYPLFSNPASTLVHYPRFHWKNSFGLSYMTLHTWRVQASQGKVIQQKSSFLFSHSLSPACIFVLCACMCAYVFTCVCDSVCMFVCTKACVCWGQRLTSGIFLDCSPSLFWRRSHSLTQSSLIQQVYKCS